MLLLLQATIDAKLIYPSMKTFNDICFSRVADEMIEKASTSKNPIVVTYLNILQNHDLGIRN